MLTLEESRICVILTVFNEENTLADVMKRTRDVLKSAKIIVVDDGSTDASAKVAQECGADLVISHARNLGVGAALRAGMKAAISRNPDVIVKIDGDGQHLPEDIPKLIKPIADGEADLVIGTRFNSHVQMPFIKKAGNRIFTWLMKRLTGCSLTDAQSGFRAMSGKVAKTLLPRTGTYTYTQEMIIHATKHKLKITEVPIASKERKYGNSRVVKNPLTYGFRVVLILIRTFRDYNPLLTFGIVGIAMLLSSVAIYCYLFFEWLIFARPIAESPTSLLVATTVLLASIQLLMFAFLADMIRGFREKEET